jgi:hypothetical protein
VRTKLTITRILILQTIFLIINIAGSFAQSEIKALAKLVSNEKNSSGFAILKDFSDTTIAGKTITVGHYYSKENFDTVLLTLNKESVENYYICTSIQKAKISYISFDYWNDCETGKGKCNPLTFTRNNQEKNWFLIMPCGGTETKIIVSGNSFNQQIHINHRGCPPFIELTNLPDGEYHANMFACGLGGGVTFNLKTN